MGGQGLGVNDYLSVRAGVVVVVVVVVVTLFCEVQWTSEV